MELSKTQKLRISVDIVNQLKENKHPNFYITCYEKNIEQKIAKKAGIQISNYDLEAGMIDIGEYINLTQDDMEHNLYRRINGDRIRRPDHSVERFPRDGVGDELKLLTKTFEEKNIKQSGPSETLIGEIFRSIQYIQYRAHNDGDIPYIIGSPTFLSYMFLISQIDKLNYSCEARTEEGEYKFEFNNDFLKQNSWDGKITNVIEHSLAMDADFIKYQLIDLLNSGKIKDIKNEYDSRSFMKLKRGRDY